MDFDQFRDWAHKSADWSADYLKGLRNRPVRRQIKPGDILKQIPGAPPETPQPMEDIFADFERIIMPGITHWQHPRFFAYFPANASPPSVIAEQLTSALAAQCMLWQTSPAGTELETAMMDWLRQAIGLPEGFCGVIQDSASSATLCAVLTMRERALSWTGNSNGLAGQPPVRIYCSDQVHSSIDRAIWIAGIGQDNLVKLPAAQDLAVDPAALERAIETDKAQGFVPAGVIACIGATSVGASDDSAALCSVAARHGLYVHIDAAWAGAAMICPEFRHMMAGAEMADSFVFNPHKWLLTNFDCTAQFLRNPDDQIRTLAIRPEYLKTHGVGDVTNYSEWTVQLGRRFRALKLWFVLRAYGLEQLREMIRAHVRWAGELASRLDREPDFEIVTQPVLALFSFRYTPDPAANPDDLNRRLIEAINQDGRICLTQSIHQGKFVIRFQVGQTYTTRADVETAGDVICEVARGLAS